MYVLPVHILFTIGGIVCSSLSDGQKRDTEERSIGSHPLPIIITAAAAAVASPSCPDSATMPSWTASQSRSLAWSDLEY